MLNRFLFLVAAVCVGSVAAELRAGDDKTAAEKSDSTSAIPADSETTEVILKDLKLTLPKSWKTVPSTSNMRLATYEIPAADGDQEAAELTVFNFNGGGGDLSANLTRWIGQFSSEGRMVEMKKGKAGENNYYVTDISGTYQKPKGPPVLRQTTPATGYRMLGVVVEIEGKGVYYLKLAGPDATVKAQAEHLRKSFGGSSEVEKDYQL